MHLSSKTVGPAPDQDFLAQLMEAHSVSRETAREMFSAWLRESRQRREVSRQAALCRRAQRGSHDEPLPRKELWEIKCSASSCPHAHTLQLYYGAPNTRIGAATASLRQLLGWFEIYGSDSPQ